MKEQFESAKAEVIAIEMKDIITESGEGELD